MSTRKHWPRWVWASFSKYFADRFETLQIPIYVEGDVRDTAKLSIFGEFRLDGPRISEKSKDYFRLFVSVNVLIQNKMDSPDTHRLHRVAGEAVAAFGRTISVFKLGNGGDDVPGELIVCMNRMDDKLNELRVNHFGIVDTAAKLQQASVEAHYEGFITE